MKAQAINGMKGLAITLILIFSAMQAQGSMYGPEKTKKDTAFKTYSGKVVDSYTRKPVVFANVYLIGSSLGTVTNGDGEFILKVPVTELNNKVGFSYLGYNNKEVPLSEMTAEDNVIKLELAAVPIKEVVVRTDDPTELVRMAMHRIDQNYDVSPEMMVGFYRETVKQNKNYVAVAEAVLDVYKSPYNSPFDIDRIKIFKGRKSQDVKKMDTILFKLQGGPKTSFLLDVVKNPGELLGGEYLEDYNFKFTGFITIDGSDNYVIEFDQKDGVDLPLYKGKLYLDTKNLAFSRIEFELSDKGIDLAGSELVRKKPIDMRVNVLGAHYLVSYRNLNDKWYLNHVRSELSFACLWKKKRFNSTYTTTLEMAVTDRNSENINKVKYSDAAKMTDVFAEQVNSFSDENYWGDYNYIKPDESIEIAIKKLNKKLKRQAMEEN